MTKPRINAPIKITAAWRKRSILMGFSTLVCLVLVLEFSYWSVFARQVEPPVGLPTALAETQPVIRRAEGPDSVAACTNVPYGTLAEGHETTDIFTNDFEGPRFVAPPNPKGATVVDLGLFIVEITDIDEKDNTFAIEGFLDLVWCDPRLAFDGSMVEFGEEIFLEEDAELAISRIWWPDITFANEVNPRERANEELEVFPDGTVEYREKFGGRLKSEYDLREFPFDEQKLEVEIESFSWSEEHLTFHVQEQKIGFSTDFEIPEWHTVAVETKLEDVQEIRDRAPFSEFIMSLDVFRRSGFYVWKIIFPLTVLVAMSWSVFWMMGDGLADRMSVSLTGMLTIVAYQFIIAEDLPRVTYFTFMDVVLTLSFILMGLSIVENVFINVLYVQEKDELAVKVDHTCRWAFPGLYVIGLGLGALFYLLL